MLNNFWVILNSSPERFLQKLIERFPAIAQPCGEFGAIEAIRDNYSSSVYLPTRFPFHACIKPKKSRWFNTICAASFLYSLRKNRFLSFRLNRGTTLDLDFVTWRVKHHHHQSRQRQVSQCQLAMFLFSFLIFSFFLVRSFGMWKDF